MMYKYWKGTMNILVHNWNSSCQNSSRLETLIGIASNLKDYYKLSRTIDRASNCCHFANIQISK